MSTHTINGLTVTVEANVPRVRDVDLAVRLGYERPAKIRELIRRLVSSGSLNGFGVIPTVGQTSERGGRPATEYWLTEEQALMVVARSETPKATEILRAVIDVFMAVKRSGPDAARGELVALSLRIAALESHRDSPWELEMKLELARLRKLKWLGVGREPNRLSFAYGRTWRCILGDTVYEEMKRRNPTPGKKSTHCKWLQDRRYELVKSEDLKIALALARQCSTWTEFESALRGYFQRAPIQLRLVRQGG